MTKVGVLISGGGTNLQALIDAKAAGKMPNVEFACVVSNRKKAYGLERAKNAGIEALYLPTVRFDSTEAYNEALRDLLVSRGVELVVLAGYLVVLQKPMLETFRNRIINIHPSLIPSFCGDGFYGLKVHEEALRRGVKVTGATVHFVDDGTDTGPIILQKAVYIEPGDTPESLQLRVMREAEWKLLPEAVRLYSEGKIRVEDGCTVILPEE